MRREKREIKEKQATRAQPLLHHAYMLDHWKDDGVTLLKSLLVAVFDHWELPHALPKQCKRQPHLFIFIIFIFIKRLNCLLLKLIITKKL
jgi:hypothetical protein